MRRPWARPTQPLQSYESFDSARTYSAAQGKRKRRVRGDAESRGDQRRTLSASLCAPPTSAFSLRRASHLLQRWHFLERWGQRPVLAREFGIVVTLLAVAILLSPGGTLVGDDATFDETSDESFGDGLDDDFWAEDADDANGDSGATENLFSRFADDPTLGGKLHLTYRARYQAKVYDFKRADLPFSPVTADDLEHVRQLRMRADDKSDQDVDQFLSMRFEDLFVPWQEEGIIQSLKGEAALRYFKDIDGSSPGEASFGGFDRFKHRQALQLQRLFARVETFSRHLELTLGRQYAREAEWAHFDGATARVRGVTIADQESEFAVFGGSRVTYYSRSASPHDGVAGGHVTVWLGDETQLNFSDVYYLRNTAEAEVRQELPEFGWMAARYRQINREPHSLTFDAHAAAETLQLTADARYVAKVSDQMDDFIFDFTQSSFRRGSNRVEQHFNISGVEPYDEFYLEVRKGLFQHYGAFVGVISHLVRGGSEEDNYNTDWHEVWIGADISDAPWRGLTGRATVRYVHTELPRRVVRLDDTALANGLADFRPEDAEGDGEPSSVGLEALIEQDFERYIAVGFTAIVRAYDYEAQFAELDFRASSLGSYVRWRPWSRHQWRLSYHYDDDFEYVSADLERLHTVAVEYQYRF